MVMLVRNRMSSKVITIGPEQSLTAARNLLHRHRIRQLPVVRKRRLVGIITDRDLRGARENESTVADLMTPKPMVIGPNASVDEAARVLTAHKIGALPVVDGGKLIGILASSDILDAFVDLSGVGETTYRIVISGAKGKQAERAVREIVAQKRGELKWLHPDTRHPNKLHLRLKTRSVDDVVTALEAAGLNVDALVAPARSRA
jgi:acetoin utilization protein AcuB